MLHEKIFLFLAKKLGFYGCNIGTCPAVNLNNTS